MTETAVQPQRTLSPEIATFCRLAVEALRAKLPVREVWLFGSQAEGKADRHSDYDFLVVLADEHGLRRPNLESYSAIREISDLESVDAVAISEGKWRREQADPWGFFGEIALKGVRVG